MAHKVLFSPVGDTDPYRNGYEGALLHIIRHYAPDRVYLFYSKLMAEKAQKDDRFKRAIRRQNELFDPVRTCPQIDEIPAVDLVDPSDFEATAVAFTAAVDRVLLENPDAEILVNVSSGTPQMKAYACLIKASQYRNRKYTHIQVINPERKSSSGQRHVDEYSDEEIDNLIDNLPEAENRTKEPGLLLLFRTMRREQLKKTIQRHDYEGALLIVEMFPDDFNEHIKKAIEHILARFQGDAKRADDVLSEELKAQINFSPVNNGTIREFYDYYLASINKYMKKEWNDYIFRITPLLFELTKYYLKRLDGENIEKYWKRRNDIEKINMTGIKADNKDMYEYLIKRDTNLSDNTNLAFSNLLLIIEYWYETNDKSNNKKKNDFDEIYMKLKQMRDVEIKIRNVAAHQMKSITEQMIKKNTEMKVQTIHNILTSLIAAIGKPEIKQDGEEFLLKINHFLLQCVDDKIK